MTISEYNILFRRSKSKMKLLICSPLSLTFDGGGATWIFEIATRLKKRGHDVTIFALKYDAGESRLTEEEINNALGGIKWVEGELIKTPFESIGLLLPTLKGVAELLALIKTTDVVYFMNAHGLDLFMILAKVLTKKPIISGIHAPLFYGSRIRDVYNFSLGKQAMRFLDGHHVLNDFYEKLFLSWSLRNVNLVSNGVDTDKIKPVLNIERGSRLRLLFVGRLAKQKGVDILCKAVHMIDSEIVSGDLELHIIGSGYLQPLVSSVAERFKNVKFLGYISSERLVKEYHESHLIVMPSRQENFSLTILEAGAFGLPALVSDIPGLREAVRNKSTGLLIKPEDPSSLIEGIKYFHKMWRNDFEKYLTFRSATLEYVASHFDWDLIIGRFEKMLLNAAWQ